MGFNIGKFFKTVERKVTRPIGAQVKRSGQDVAGVLDNKYVKGAAAIGLAATGVGAGASAAILATSGAVAGAAKRGGNLRTAATGAATGAAAAAAASGAKALLMKGGARRGVAAIGGRAKDAATSEVKKIAAPVLVNKAKHEPSPLDGGGPPDRRYGWERNAQGEWYHPDDAKPASSDAERNAENPATVLRPWLDAVRARGGYQQMMDTYNQDERNSIEFRRRINETHKRLSMLNVNRDKPTVETVEMMDKIAQLPTVDVVASPDAALASEAPAAAPWQKLLPWILLAVLALLLLSGKKSQG